jgi:hypothetical protein
VLHGPSHGNRPAPSLRVAVFKRLSLPNRTKYLLFSQIYFCDRENVDHSVTEGEVFFSIAMFTNLLTHPFHRTFLCLGIAPSIGNGRSQKSRRDDNYDNEM